MKEKFLLDLPVQRLKNMQLEVLKKDYSDLEVVTDFLDYHNNVCPRCETNLKVYNNTIKNLGGVSVFVIPTMNKAYLYSMCKSCSKKLQKQSDSFKHSEQAEATEDYILTTLSQ